MESSLILISGPSGAGKSTLINAFLGIPSISFAISHTTREKRPNEIDQKDYFFISKTEFIEKREKGEFYETTEYDQNLYGTSYSELSKNKIVIIDVEREGSTKFTEFNVLKIFVFCTKEAIYERLKTRYKNDLEKVERRLKSYEADILNSKSGIYNHVIISNSYEENLKELKKYISDFSGIRLN